MKATKDPQEHVDLVLVAAVKALSELYQGGYDVSDFDDGFVGIRVHLNMDQVERIAGPGRRGDKSIRRLIVDFEKGRFHFERGEVQ